MCSQPQDKTSPPRPVSYAKNQTFRPQQNTSHVRYYLYVPIANVDFPFGPQSNKTETIKNTTPRRGCKTSDISGGTRLEEHVQFMRSTGTRALLS